MKIFPPKPPAPGSARTGRPTEQAGELGTVARHIEQARALAEEAEHGLFYDGGHKFYESGDIGAELDDQTIAPPG